MTDEHTYSEGQEIMDRVDEVIAVAQKAVDKYFERFTSALGVLIFYVDEYEVTCHMPVRQRRDDGQPRPYAEGDLIISVGDSQLLHLDYWDDGDGEVDLSEPIEWMEDFLESAKQYGTAVYVPSSKWDGAPEIASKH